MRLLPPSTRFAVFAVTSLALASCSIHPGNVPQIVGADGATPVTVATRSGPVVGASAQAGRAFLGIPYAAPPVGTLRWQPPQPAQPWATPRDARKLGSACMQAISFNPGSGEGGGLAFGDEDCLYLNVYTPPTPASEALPVMAYLPGGAFVVGAGDNYDPSRLATEQQVIVVTINYRLGPLGFLAHPALTRASPTGGSGNYGLLDQQAALRWIRDNIRGFGGDPGKVTLFGESAGAWSTCYQMVAPGAETLFQRVILQSGSCIDPVSQVSAAEADAAGVDYAKKLGCDDTPDVLACLYGASPRSLVRTSSTRRGIIGPASWGPVWGDTVVPLRPEEAFAQGKYAKVPAIIGSNLDEGRLFAITTRSQEAFETQVRRQFGDGAPKILARYSAATKGSVRLAYAAVWTDARLACPAEALRQVLRSRSDVHAYEFADERAPISLPGFMQGGPMGAYHAGELAYVFGTRWALADPADFDASQVALSNAMMAAWGRFARGEAPAADWPTYNDGGSVRSLSPGTPRLITDFADRHQCAFWTTLLADKPVGRAHRP